MEILAVQVFVGEFWRRFGDRFDHALGLVLVAAADPVVHTFTA
jgi:hypothetical protein